MEFILNGKTYSTDEGARSVRMMNTKGDVIEVELTTPEEVSEKLSEFVLQDRKLPSAYQIEDKVNVSFGEAGSIQGCEVIKIHFSHSKVMYDISVPILVEGLQHDEYIAHTRLYNIDSCFVQKA